MTPELKKLTTGFLVLTIAASSLALALPLLWPSSTPTPAPAASPAADLSRTNAFADAASPGTAEADHRVPAPEETTNLTQRLGAALAQEFIRANEKNLDGSAGGLLAPSGPSLDAAITKYFASSDAVRLAIPNLSGAVSDSSLTVIRDPSPEDIARYNTAVATIAHSTVLGNDFQGVLAASPSLESIYAAENAYGEAVHSLLATPVPAPLLSFHKALIALLQNRQTLADLSTGDDPLKSVVAIRALTPHLDDLLARDGKRLNDAASAAAAALDAYPPLAAENTPFARVFALLGVPEAHAQFVPVESAGPKIVAFQVTETGATTGNWLRRIWEWVQKALLQQLKFQIISMLEYQIVNWINGNGSPQFVTDWKGFLSDAFNNAAGAIIEQVAPSLCYGVGPFIQIALHVPVVEVPVYVGCRLSDVVRNVKNFYNDYRTYGIAGYVAVVQDNGWGVSIDLADAQLNAAVKSTEAAVNKAVSGNGFLGTQVCPSTGKAWKPNTSCPGGEEPVVRTPGFAAGHALADALNLPAEGVVNAQDITGLVQVVTDAAITRLITAGLAAASGQPTGSYGGYGVADIPFTSTNGYQQAANFAAASSTNLSTSGSVPQKQQILNTTGALLSSLGDPACVASTTSCTGTLSYDTRWLNLAPLTKAALAAVQNACQASGSNVSGRGYYGYNPYAAIVNQAAQQSAAIDTITPQVQSDLAQAQTAQSQIAAIQASTTVTQDTDYTTISSLYSQITAYSANDFSAEASAAFGRYEALTTLNAAAEKIAGTVSAPVSSGTGGPTVNIYKPTPSVVNVLSGPISIGANIDTQNSRSSLASVAVFWNAQTLFSISAADGTLPASSHYALNQLFTITDPQNIQKQNVLAVTATDSNGKSSTATIVIFDTYADAQSGGGGSCSITLPDITAPPSSQ